AVDSGDKYVQRIVLAALGPEPIREAEEVFLVDRVQHRACRLLDDLVFECGNCERALLTISLRYVMSPRRQSPICSPMDPGVQVLDLAIEVCLVVLPCQPIHTRCGISLEGEECHPEEFNADMVEERGEPFLLPLPCDLPYALQRLCHTFPVLRPARALLARIPLGLRTWLHRLRSRLSGFVRRLPSYYCGV